MKDPLDCFVRETDTSASLTRICNANFHRHKRLCGNKIVFIHVVKCADVSQDTVFNL